MDSDRLLVALEPIIPTEDTRRGFLWYLDRAGVGDREELARAIVGEHSTNGDGPHRQLYPLLSDLDAESLPPPAWGLDGIYPDGGLVTLFGPRGIGKTFLALGWSFGHATGSWLGRTAVPGPTVHILAEGRGGLGARVRAQKAALGIRGRADVYFIPTAVPMLNRVEVDRLIATIEQLEVPPAAILWDTLSRTFVGGDENSSKDMAEYVASVDRVKEAVGGTAIVLHHSGHTADRERGSSVLGGAADTIVALREKDGALELTCEKQKDGPEFAPLLLGLQKVEESCVLKVHDGAWTYAGFLSKVEAQGLRALHDSFMAGGAPSSTWLDVSEMPKSSFFKAQKSLVERGLVQPKGEGRGTRYVVTEEGARLLKIHRSTDGPR